MDQAQSDSTVCAICGTALRPEDRYCPSCGAPNPNHRPSTSAPQPSEPSATQPAETVGWPAQLQPPADSDQFSSASTQPDRHGWTTTPPPRGNQRTWWILGAIVAFFILVCCCCLIAIAIASSQDSALQRELEGTASMLGAVL